MEALGEYEIRRENMKVWGLHNAKKKEMKKTENSLSEACGEVLNESGVSGGVIETFAVRSEYVVGSGGL